MFRVFQQAEAYALTDYNLMITGETGVGKEVLARIIHKVSL
ncbi:MAG: sigma 54-interacting transcriptional regulator [Deltaproteobacteria bacterium]|nr:sigma 54-interacting transcriptional regulator [Deltaproteobacteria bacterium]